MRLQSNSDAIRLFVAVELVEEARAALDGLVQGLQQAKVRGLRTVDSQRIHLTLKFLGDVPVERVGRITDALGQAVQGVCSFALELRGVGGFPNLQRPRVLWVGFVGAVEPLLALQRAVEEALGALGFPAEGRPFTPHLTLARLREDVSPQERRQAGEALSHLRWREGAPVPVHAVSLMRSTLRPEGALYTRLHSVPLQECA